MDLRCALALAVCAGCFFKPDPPSATGSGSDSGVVDDGAVDGQPMIDAPPVPWLANYNRRRRITMARPTNPPGTLVDFPVSVVLEADNELRTHSQSQLELVFTDGSGVLRLEHEIRDYSRVAGRLEAWVLVPSLPVGTTDIFLYYDGPEITNPQPALVWSNTYAVWHMDGTTTEADVTGKVNVVTAPFTSLPTRGVGVVGLARVYDGDDYLCVSQTNVLPVETKPFSYSLWVGESSSADMNDTPLARGAADNDPGFAFAYKGGPAWEAVVSDGIVTSSLSLSPPSNAWTHLAVSVDNPNDTLIAYVNGAQTDAAMPTNLGNLGMAGTFCMGTASSPFKGAIDEVRVWDAAHPAAWFATEHLNVMARTAFMSIAAEELR